MSRYGKKKLDENLMKRDFANYADMKEKKIKQEGMEKMGKTLGIDIYTDIFITYFFYKCNAKSMEEITEKEYITGLTNFNCSDLKGVKANIIRIKEELLDLYSDDFKKFYNFLYKFNVGNAKGISYEVVEVYFNDLFAPQFPITKEILTFLKEDKKEAKLSKDEWECFLDFFLDKGNTFPKDYNCAEYYPILIDDFYRAYCKKHGIKIKEEEEYY